MKADGDILLQAAQNTFEQHTKNKSYSGSVGIGVSANSEDGIGVMLNLSAGGGRGRADGKDANWTYTDVTAGNVLALQSGGDTSLIGAIASADQIIASVGKNLQIETLQDTSTYVSKQQSAGVQASICIYRYCKSSVSGNVSQGRMESNFQSATQQAGMKAGEGGFLVNVGQNTTLTGGVISSSEQAVADGLNQLSTGTLVVKDLQNTARYKADQVALSGGYSWGGSGEGDAKKGDVGTNSKGQAAGGADKVPGTSLPTSSNGASAGLPVVVAASGNANSTTYSAISGGSVAIRDGAGQLALTGKTAAETIAALNRDTSDTLNALKPIFDKEKIEAGFEIASEAQRQVGQFLTNRAKEADALEKAMKSENDPTRYAELESQYKDAKLWLPGGTYRRIANAVMIATGSNVTGAAADIAQRALVSYVQQLGAAEVGKWVSSGIIRDGSAEHAALQGIVGCSAAAASGQSCAAGATGGAAAVLINALLDNTQGSSNEEREARRNLVASLIAGAAAVAGADGIATITSAAIAELDNNSLDPKLHESLINRFALSDQLQPEEYEDLIQRMKAANAEGTQQALDQMKSVFGPESLEATRAELEAMLGGNSACGQVPACALQLKNSIKELDSLLAQYKRQSELTPKVDAALMIFDLATSGVGGVIRGPVFDAVRMSATRAAGGSLEMAAAKIAYADGASWTVRNAEVLAADGKTVLARQNPITGKYDAVSPNPLINAGNGTGTVWDSIKATQPPYPGSVIPKSFELSLSSGQKIWVHGNATEHMAEYAKMKAINFTPEAVRLSSQQQLTSLQAAVDSATKGGVPYGKVINVEGWELIFSPPRASGGLPALIHALSKK
ncbi:hemagglutinin repeat-containing protein [Achromobacter sp. ESBL13]|uniref:hemagglutinin repeat-containing protein n=1 Tax=Achromobacter sp. ESBL13 TaxID=3077328 RepID=UPI002FC8EA0D